jgi:CelD/BcsL family acetyltransferase involved in cellulose biosynthesis
VRFEDARADWLELWREAAVSPYQSFDFLSAWFDAFGREDGATPFLVCARDARGRPSALLPLCLDRIGPFCIATYLGGRESNFNLPLLRPGLSADAESMRALLLEACRRAPIRPDVFYLRNQPRLFEERVNPLVFASARQSVSAAYETRLPESVDELRARLSGPARKKLRKKELRLAEYGALRYEHNVGGARGDALIETLLEQKAERFAAVTLSCRKRYAALLSSLLDKDGDCRLELHGLSAGERIVAVYAGFRRGGRFSAMLNSFEMSRDVAACSPGELLLHALMRDLVLRGVTHFDLGSGEARYKFAVCNETVALYDQIVPVSARGCVAAPLLAGFLSAKRRAKRSPALVRAVYRIKALLDR